MLFRSVEEALAKESVPDEEGWTTVSKYGKNKGAPRTEAQENKTRARNRNSKRNKEKVIKVLIRILDSNHCF